ncbi:CRISPR-associated protein Csx11 [Caminibacter mediatlanticus]|nr:CRISPR-associated protein Csx11 [Caminibacter mediatlanticus]
MSRLDLEKLKQYRDEILKAEIGALLFNLGKTHIGIGNWKDYFNNFQSQFSSYKNYYQNNIFENELESISQDLKDFIINKQVKISDSKKIDWIEFFKGDASNENFIQKVFFRGCENINSGIDKGSPKEQLKYKLWLSNAFGSYKEEIDETYFDDARNNFFCKLNFFLQDNNYYQNPNWQEIRNFILKEIKKWYSHLLSDNRFPVNDVSLFDQAYMTASMFKAVLSQLVIDNSKLSSYQNNPSSIKWRILGIQYDKLGLAEKGYKPSQIMWYRDISREIDKEIQDLLEIKYPIGNEIYKDETGVYFIVVEDFELSNKLKKEILKIFKNKTDDEFYPSFVLSKSSRGLMNLTTLLEQAKENFLKQDFSLKNKNLCLEFDENKYPIGVCQVCKTRIVYNIDKKDEDKNICGFCYENKTKGRLDKWLKNQKDETIWIDELADDNNRVALVTLKFELSEWLNGDLLNSLLVRNESFEEYKNEIMSAFNILIKNLKSQDVKSLNITDNDEKTFEKFFELYDRSGIYEPFKTMKNVLKEHKNLNNVSNERGWRDLTKNLLAPNWIKEYYSFYNSATNEIIKNKKKGKKVKLNEYIEDDGVKTHLYKIFILNYFMYQVYNTLLERSIGQKWEEFIYKQLNDWDIQNNEPKKQKINFENRKIYWNNLTENDIEVLSKILLQFILRKNPSPA